MLDKETKELLNKFAETQPALNKVGSPASTSGVKLGDLLESLEDFEASDAANWEGAAPKTLAEAVRRIEAALVALMGTSIP